MKKYTLMALLTVFLLTFMSSVQVSANDDITGHVFEKEMRSLESLKIMNGDGKGNFFPNQLVTRAQFAAFLNRALKLPDVTTNPFNDTVNHSLASEVGNAAAAGIINGVGEGKFMPDRTLTREEIALMVSRVIKSKGLTASPAQTPSFTDGNDIKYFKDIQPIFAYGLMEGYSDGTFRPKEQATRAQTAAVIYKMYYLLQKQEQDQQKDDEKENQEDESVSKDDDDEAESEVDYTKGNYIVIASKLLNVYEEGMKRVRTYVNAGTEMKFLDIDGNVVEVEVAGTVGYVNKDDVKIVHENEVENRFYYKVVGGDLRHYVAPTGKYESYVYGPAPRFLKEGDVDYSFDGKNFRKGTYYQYFVNLPLLSETRYSAEDLDDYIKSQSPTSPLIGLGGAFKEAEEETGVNALYLLAHAIHESSWGTSKIATDKHNLYGIRAIDADAYNSAKEFASFEECILYAANYIKDNYLTPGDRKYYFGSFLGNKGAGVTSFYASDSYWGQKIAGHMYRADLYLGKKDWDNYQLAISKVPSLNVRTGPSTDDKIIYEHRYTGVVMIVLDKVKRSDGTWYKIKSDHPDYEEAYIYADGEKGEFAEIIN